MKKSLFFTILAFVFSSCGGSGGTSSFSKVTEATMTSVPMIKDSETITAQSIAFKKTSNLKAISSSELDFTQLAASGENAEQIKSFFKLECHMNSDSTNFCPEGIDYFYSDESPDDYKLTIGTLIGLVYHAIMYGQNIYNSDPSYKTCTKGDNAVELTDQTPYFEGQTSHPLIITIDDFFDCVSSFTYEGPAVYTTYSKATNDDRYGIITARKEAPSEFYDDSSDITQVYASQVNTEGVPELIASNSASTNSMHNRAIILANVATHKFAAKYHSSDANYLVAIGKAGVNADGTWVTGNYLVKSVTGGTTKIYCIANGETPTVVSATDCEDITDLITLDGTTNWTDADLPTYLGITDTTDLANLANFFTELNNGNPLDANQVPELPASGGHDEFPANITATAN